MPQEIGQLPDKGPQGTEGGKDEEDTMREEAWESLHFEHLALKVYFAEVLILPVPAPNSLAVPGPF